MTCKPLTPEIRDALHKALEDSTEVIVDPDIKSLRAEIERLRNAVECLIVGACAVAVPHKGERSVLEDAVNIGRKALKGGK